MVGGEKRVDDLAGDIDRELDERSADQPHSPPLTQLTRILELPNHDHRGADLD